MQNEGLCFFSKTKIQEIFLLAQNIKHDQQAVFVINKILCTKAFVNTPVRLKIYPKIFGFLQGRGCFCKRNSNISIDSSVKQRFSSVKVKEMCSCCCTSCAICHNRSFFITKYFPNEKFTFHGVFKRYRASSLCPAT